MNLETALSILEAPNYEALRREAARVAAEAQRRMYEAPSAQEGEK